MPDDVLIVEDDTIIAIDFEATVLELGAQSVRIASSVTQAFAMIIERVPDFALLDIGLGPENSFSVAEHLEVLKVPFVFVTGYRTDMTLAGRFADRPVLSKPCQKDELAAVLRGNPTMAE